MILIFGNCFVLKLTCLFCFMLKSQKSFHFLVLFDILRYQAILKSSSQRVFGLNDILQYNLYHRETEKSRNMRDFSMHNVPERLLQKPENIGAFPFAIKVGQ